MRALTDYMIEVASDPHRRTGELLLLFAMMVIPWVIGVITILVWPVRHLIGV